MTKTEQFYKLAQPDGFDFYTGKTINYREAIGKAVRCPTFDAKGNLCSSAFIHASREPNQCFVGAKIPCSAYLVRGTLILEDTDKCGFGELRVEKELNPSELFRWKYAEAANPVNPLNVIRMNPQPSEAELELLKEWASMGASVGASVWASVGDSVGDSVWASVRDSLWASVGASVGASVWASVGDSVGASVGASVRASVGASVWAYIGWIFSEVVHEWKYVEYKQGEYPFMPAVNLWKAGLMPTYDGSVWRLHAGPEATVIWMGKV